MSLFERASTASERSVATVAGWVLPKRHGHDTRLRRARDAAVLAQWGPDQMSLVAQSLIRCSNFLLNFRQRRMALERKRQFEILRDELSWLFVRISGEMDRHGRFLALHLPGDAPVRASWEALLHWMTDECRQSLLAGKV